jgi:hypothetical protein
MNIPARTAKQRRRPIRHIQLEHVLVASLLKRLTGRKRYTLQPPCPSPDHPTTQGTFSCSKTPTTGWLLDSLSLLKPNVDVAKAV